MKLSKSLILLLPMIVVFSCTVQKRVYNSGYHVEWKKKYAAAGNTKKGEVKIAESPAENTHSSAEPVLVATAENSRTEPFDKKEFPAEPVQEAGASQDDLTLSPLENGSFRPVMPVRENDDTVYVEVNDPSRYGPPEQSTMRGYLIFRIIISVLLFLTLLYLLWILLLVLVLSSGLGYTFIGPVVLVLFMFLLFVTLIQLLFHFNRPDRKRARRRKKLLESLEGRIGPDDVVVPVETGSRVIKKPSGGNPPDPVTD